MNIDDHYLEMRSADDIRVKGTRVGLEHVLSAYLAGSLPEEIALEFPTVTLEQVHGVIAWFLGHREMAGAYLLNWQGRARKMRTEQSASDQAEVVQRLRRLSEERVAG